MHIKIAERLTPYSHNPGTYFVLPGSSCRLRIFPARIDFDDLSGNSSEHLSTVLLNINGPLSEFTVQQDLEKGCVRVWGHSRGGFIRYRLNALANGKGVAIAFEKTPPSGIACTVDGIWSLNKSQTMLAGEILYITAGTSAEDQSSLYTLQPIDRLSLGSHKSQDWELIRRRHNFAEILPIWHRLGQMVPTAKQGDGSGTEVLLGLCREVIATNGRTEILGNFERLFLTSFDGGLSPRLQDADFQGITFPELSPSAKASPLRLLTDGAAMIRSLFVQETKKAIQLLPALPPDFHCGRILDVRCGGGGSLNMEWTKKAVRRFTFVSERTQQLAFTFSDGKKRCRVRQNNLDRGRCFQTGEEIEVLAGQNYWFDNFEK